MLYGAECNKREQQRKVSKGDTHGGKTALGVVLRIYSKFNTVV